ncbi:MAG: phenylalanine--tRNA ligase subunit alpha [bacterium]
MDTEALRTKAFEEIKNAQSYEDIERIRIHYIGRKGVITGLLRSLKDLPLAERKTQGSLYQTLCEDIFGIIEEKKKSFSHTTYRNKFDITRPAIKKGTGHMHPLSIVDKKMREIFMHMNFSVVDGPELETEYYNFDALNIPTDHPAREMWDTFWIKKEEQTKIGRKNDRLLLRTHTSPVQIRYMETHEPPFQIVVPGRTFRYEAMDASHEINFYQFEGLMVGKDITIGNFKFVIEEFFRMFFGKEIDFRYRVSYFPFVEPGLEVDVRFKGKWLEVMGAGMVHPAVFRYAGIDPKKVQGFAFGMCIDRLAMIKYQIPDIRFLYDGDMRFVKQFRT